MAVVKLLDGTLVDSADPRYMAECAEIHGSAVAIRRMSRDMQAHAYETLAKNNYEAALEAAALECEKYDSLRIDGAGETIRDLKEKP